MHLSAYNESKQTNSADRSYESLIVLKIQSEIETLIELKNQISLDKIHIAWNSTVDDLPNKWLAQWTLLGIFIRPI